MSDIQEKIAEVLGYKLPLLCDGKHAKGLCDLERIQAILSIVREAVSAVKPNYKSYDDGEMSTAAKVADDYHEALMEALS